MKKLNRIAALTLSTAMALTACANGQTNGPQTQTGGEELTTFVDWQTQANEVTTFLLLYTEARAETKVLVNVYSPLIEYDNYGVMHPAMATDWGSEDGGLTWTFHLREGVHWVDIDGNEKDECTAWDWMTAMEWILNFHKNDSKNTSMPISMIAGAQAYYEYTKGLDEAEAKALKATDDKFLSTVGIEAPDDYTLVYHCNKETPYFYTLAACACLYPLPQGQIDEIGVDATLAQTPETMWSNGPYRLTEYVQNNSKVMVKNDKYWDADAKLFDSVTVMMVQDANSDDDMFFNGEIDRCDLSEARLRTIYGDENNEWRDNLVQVRSPGANRQILFNYAKNNKDGTPDTNWNTAIANEAFRKSIYYGLDLTEYWSRFDFIDPASCEVETFTVPGTVQFSDGTDYTDRVVELLGVADGRYDAQLGAQYVAQAKEELTAQGVTFPVQMDYYIKSGDQSALDNATVLKNLINHLGEDYIQFNIEFYVTSSSQEVYIPSLHSIGISGWIADFGDPENFLEQLVRESDGPGFATRIMHVNDVTNADSIALLDSYTAKVNEACEITGDMDARYEAQAQAEAYLYEHAMAIPLYANNNIWSLTKVNSYSVKSGSYGSQNDVYKNWETSVEPYTSEQYKAFKAAYEAGGQAG